MNLELDDQDRIRRLRLRNILVDDLINDLDQKLRDALHFFRSYDPRNMDPEDTIETSTEFLFWLVRYIERSMSRIKQFVDVDPESGGLEKLDLGDLVLDAKNIREAFTIHWGRHDSENEEEAGRRLSAKVRENLAYLTTLVRAPNSSSAMESERKMVTGVDLSSFPVSISSSTANFESGMEESQTSSKSSGAINKTSFDRLTQTDFVLIHSLDDLIMAHEPSLRMEGTQTTPLTHVSSSLDLIKLDTTRPSSSISDWELPEVKLITDVSDMTLYSSHNSSTSNSETIVQKIEIRSVGSQKESQGFKVTGSSLNSGDGSVKDPDPQSTSILFHQNMEGKETSPIIVLEKLYEEETFLATSSTKFVTLSSHHRSECLETKVENINSFFGEVSSDGFDSGPSTSSHFLFRRCNEERIPDNLSSSTSIFSGEDVTNGPCSTGSCASRSNKETVTFLSPEFNSKHRLPSRRALSADAFLEQSASKLESNTKTRPQLRIKKNPKCTVPSHIVGPRPKIPKSSKNNHARPSVRRSRSCNVGSSKIGPEPNERFSKTSEASHLKKRPSTLAQKRFRVIPVPMNPGFGRVKSKSSPVERWKTEYRAAYNHS